MHIFDESMRAGAWERDRGHFNKALVHYELAKTHAPTMINRAEALGQIGATFRLMGAYVNASSSFEDAFDNLRNEKGDTALGWLLREFGRLALDIAMKQGAREQLDTAKIRFVRSIAVFIRLNDTTGKAISRSFLGRTYYMMGERERAIGMLLSAHRQLRKSHDIASEQENLVWLARASAWYRWRYAVRGLWVSMKLKRLKEYLALLVGGERLYATREVRD